MKIIITIILLVLLLAGGYYIYNKNFNNITLPSYNSTTVMEDDEESLTKELDQLETEDFDEDLSTLDADLQSL